MTSDPWAEFRVPSGGAPPAAAPANADPWAEFRVSAPPASPPAAPQARSEADIRAEYDALPWYGKAGQALDDVVRLAADGASFGYADKLAGYLSGTGTEAERARTAEAKVRAGGAGTVAEIGGAVATPVGLARAGASLPALASKIPGFTGAGVRTGLAGVEGAGYGAADASGHDRSLADGMLLGAIFGTGGNALGEAVMAGAGKLAGLFNRKPTLPTVDEIRVDAKAAYDAADNSGVSFTPQAATRLRDNVVNSLTNFGYDPALQPGAKAVLDRIEALAASGNHVTFKGLDTIRKVAGNGFVPGNAANNKAVSQIIGAIDDLVANPVAGDVIGGNAADAGTAVAAARELWSRLAKVDTVRKATERGDLNAAASGTGTNWENTTRQALKSVALNENAVRGFKPDELAALRAAIQGSPDQNALRLLGRLAPTGIISSGIGIGGGAGLGAALGGPTGALIGGYATPAVGIAARTAASAMEGRSVNRLLDIIMAGGNAANALPRPNAVQNALGNSYDDVVRAVFGLSQNQAGEANERLRRPYSGAQ